MGVSHEPPTPTVTLGKVLGIQYNHVGDCTVSVCRRLQLLRSCCHPLLSWCLRSCRNSRFRPFHIPGLSSQHLFCISLMRISGTRRRSKEPVREFGSGRSGTLAYKTLALASNMLAIPVVQWGSFSFHQQLSKHSNATEFRHLDPFVMTN